MNDASKLRRRLEITLLIVGVLLLGIAFEETLIRWNYQAQQERALEREPAISVQSVQPSITPINIVPTKQPAQPETPKRITTASTPPIQTKRRVDAAPAAFARIEIPRLGVAAIVQEGADEHTLARAVGLVPGSAHPGELGNIVLAGHRDTFFRPLRNIKVNDRIRMIVPPHTYEYRVQSLRIVAPEETNVLASNGVEELTLVTCFPFRYIGPAPDRFIVSATRVN